MLLRAVFAEVLQRLDRLEERYWQMALEGDLKACAGFMSCIEVRMKLFGLDGRQEDFPQNERDAASTFQLVDPEKLSDKALEEILRAIVRPSSDRAQEISVNDNDVIISDGDSDN